MKITNKILFPVILLLIVTIGGSGIITYHQSREKILLSMVDAQLNNTLTSIFNKMESDKKALDATRQVLDEKHLAISKSIAEMINSDRSFLDNKKLTDLALELNISEIHIIDEYGKIAFGNVEEFIGFDFNTSEQTKPFLAGIKDKNFAMAQAPSERGTDKTLFQYVGVGRIDEPGVVQIGIEPRLTEELTALMDVQKLVANTQIGNTGYAYVLDRNGVTLAHKNIDNIGKNVKEMDWSKPIFEKTEGTFEYEYEGKARFSAFKQTGDRIIAVVYPEEEFLRALIVLRMTTVITMFIAILLIASIIYLLIRKQVTVPLSKLVKAMEQAGSGNLSVTADIKSKDEIGKLSASFNLMIGSMKKLISEVKTNSEDIIKYTGSLAVVSEEMSASSTEVANAVQEVAQGAGAQAEDLVHITEVFEEFALAIENIVIMAEEANESTAEVNGSAKASDKKLSELTQSIGTISKAFSGVSQKINDLGVNISKINEITNVINSIADQTNLLALNAAIEAARAGESGRGFAVVADEIRKLAEQSKVSSESINSMVAEIAVEAEGAVNTTHSVNENLENQLTVVEQSVESFRKIISSIELTLPKIENIKESAAKINENKNAIVSKIEATTSVAEETSASSEEIAASAEQMNASAEEVASSANALSEMSKTMKTNIEKFSL
jgi:methyl-accepting chemotaxis protein